MEHCCYILIAVTAIFKTSSKPCPLLALLSTVLAGISGHSSWPAHMYITTARAS